MPLCMGTCGEAGALFFAPQGNCPFLWTVDTV